MPEQPSRRAVLRLGGLGAAGVLGVLPTVTGCTSPSTTAEPPPPPSPDEQARSAAARREDDLAQRASRTVGRHPELTVASQAAAAHTAHAKALSETLAPKPPTPSTSPSGTAIAVPSSRTAAAAELAAAELAASEAHRTALTKAGVTGDVARLLASVAASDSAFATAVHAQGPAS